MGIEAEEINQEESIDLAALANAEDQSINNEDTDNQNEDLNLSEIEQEAYDQGWRPESEYTGKEGNWKTPITYIVDGKYYDEMKSTHAEIKQMKVDFDRRLENSNKLHVARTAREISDLKAQQRDAVMTSDTEAYDDAQKQIEKLEEAPVEVKKSQTVDPVISEWESKNAWINDLTDERTPVAQGIWNQYIAKNPTASNAQAIDHVDSRMNALYPTNNSNPRRNQQNTNETPAKRGKKSSKTLTMGDLTQDEKSEWAMFGQTMFKDESAFLSAVKDARVK